MIAYLIRVRSNSHLSCIRRPFGSLLVLKQERSERFRIFVGRNVRVSLCWTKMNKLEITVLEEIKTYYASTYNAWTLDRRSNGPLFRFLMMRSQLETF